MKNNVLMTRLSHQNQVLFETVLEPISEQLHRPEATIFISKPKTPANRQTEKPKRFIFLVEFGWRNNLSFC